MYCQTPFWIILLLLFNRSIEFIFKLGSEPICMNFKGGNKYTFMYVVSGIDNQNVKVKISSQGQILIQKEQVKDFQLTRQYSSDVQICFQSTDSKSKQISFDFYKTDNPIRSVIEKKDLATVSFALKQTKSMMQSISRNQQFHIERDEVHKITLQQSQNHIKWTGAIKIIFLLSSALIQLWIMKSFFKNTSQSYIPVQTI